MKSKKDLHKLIKSMHTTEKRNYKIFNKRNNVHGSGNYELLFDLIDKQDKYNEDEIMLQLSGKPMTKQLSVSKHHLYNQILRSIEFFQFQKTNRNKVKSYLLQISTLYERTLYTQSREIIKKAITIAQQSELIDQEIELLNWERLNLLALIQNHSTLNSLNEIHQKINSLTHQQSITHQLAYLDSLIIFHIKTKGLSVIKEAELIHRLLNENELLNTSKTFDYAIQNFYYHHILSLYFYILDNQEKSYHHRRALVTLFEEKKWFIEENKSGYITALNNLALVCQQTQNREVFNLAIEKLNTISPDNLEQEKNIQVNILTQELLYHYYSGDYEEVIKLKPEIEAIIFRFKSRLSLSAKVLFNFVISGSFLSLKKHSDALTHINIILDLPDVETIEDLYRFTILFRLMAHSALNNHMLLNSLIISAQRMFKKIKPQFKIETELLKLMIDVAHKTGKPKKVSNRLKILQQIKKLLSDPQEKRIQAYFDFESWVDDQLAKS